MKKGLVSRFGRSLRGPVVLCVALVVAMSGTAIAKQLLTGADIWDGSITGADISDESTLKGVDIDEAELDKVPTAFRADDADRADLAGHAGTANQLKSAFEITLPKQDKFSPDSYLVHTLLNGLRIRGRCADETGLHLDIEVTPGTDPPFSPSGIEAHGTIHRPEGLAYLEDEVVSGQRLFLTGLFGMKAFTAQLAVQKIRSFDPDIRGGYNIVHLSGRGCTVAGYSTVLPRVLTGSPLPR